MEDNFYFKNGNKRMEFSQDNFMHNNNIDNIYNINDIEKYTTLKTSGKNIDGLIGCEDKL